MPALTAGIQNQGLNNYVPKNNATILKNVISISANGKNTGATFYQNKEFTVLQDAYAIRWKDKNAILNDCHYLFLAGTISKAIYGNYEWTNKAGWERIKTDKIFLPITSAKKIDFDFIEEFIAELEAWLRAAGLENYELTKEERSAIEDFDSTPTIPATLNEHISIKNIIGINSDALTDGDCYDYITRTSMDQGILGSTGVVKNAKLNPKNTWSLGLLQMDFFMRKHPWYAGQFVRILEPKNILNENQMLWFTAILNKQKQSLQSVLVRDVNEKLRNTIIRLPAKSGQPDYSKMATIISAVKKLVIKDVAEYANKKIRVAQQVIAK